MEEIARTYANALFQVAAERDKLASVNQQLGQFADYVESNDELQLFLFSPYFSGEEKGDGLRRAIDGAEPELLNFLVLLAEKHRLPLIDRVRKQFEAQYADHEKVLPVTVTSAVALADETVEQISQSVASQTGRKVEMESRVDADILGGIVLQVGNRVLDASIRNRLDKLRKQITAVA